MNERTNIKPLTVFNNSYKKIHQFAQTKLLSEMY